MMVCLEQRPEFFEFFNAVSGALVQPGRQYVIASLRGTEIAAVVMYGRVSRGACEMSVMSDGRCDWVTRAFRRAAFDYPFKVLNLNRISSFVDVDNQSAIALNVRLGFQLEGVARQYLDGRDAYAMSLLRTECKWI